MIMKIKRDGLKEPQIQPSCFIFIIISAPSLPRPSQSCLQVLQAASEPLPADSEAFPGASLLAASEALQDD